MILTPVAFTEQIQLFTLINKSYKGDIVKYNFKLGRCKSCPCSHTGLGNKLSHRLVICNDLEKSIAPSPQTDWFGFCAQGLLAITYDCLLNISHQSSVKCQSPSSPAMTLGHKRNCSLLETVIGALSNLTRFRTKRLFGEVKQRKTLSYIDISLWCDMFSLEFVN